MTGFRAAFGRKAASLSGFLVLALALACGGTSTPPPFTPPASITYPSNPAVYTLGQAIPPNAPTTTGGPAVAFAISPALPDGLSLNAATGVISGTPSTLMAATTYTVTASNTGGRATVALTITINDAAPTNLTYATNPAAYALGATIPTNHPSHAGGAVLSYTVSPDLPPGLSLNLLTGDIDGTTTAEAATAVYTVTATNSGGTATAALTITVADTPPNALTYPLDPTVYTKGLTIPPNVPTHGGGRVASYAVTPPLPLGLTLDAVTGTISGTPTMVAAAATYAVTAANVGGSTSATLTITVIDVPPTNLTYTATSLVATKGTPIPTFLPSSAGGTVVTYSISPALPAGLTLDPTTGILTGTPTALAPLGTYTISASNSGGSTTTSLAITVIDVAPQSLGYANPTPTYTRGVPIPDNLPSSQGGAVVSYTITPALPAGLSLDGTTGVISGVPTQVAATANYIVTARNTGGTTSAVLTLTVNDAPPAISYGGSSFTFYRSSAITPLVLLNPGGAILSCSITPSLPAGLSFNTLNGTISGTPTALSPPTLYTVTATNTGGSSVTTPTIQVSYPLLAITTQPASQTVSIAQTASFSVAATGGSTLSYQWSKNAVPIAGATSAVYTTPPTSLADNGASFSVVVSDTFGQAVSSSAATLTVVQGLFSASSPLGAARTRHTATLLPSGRVLIAGGLGNGSTLATAEVYDPVTRTFSSTTGSLARPRMNHTATLLPSGLVLLAGGSDGSSTLATAELYDPASRTFSAAPGTLSAARQDHTALLLPTGKVLLAGGSATGVLASAELYDPLSGTFSATGALGTARTRHTATLLPDGRVLVAGGTDLASALASAEAYDPATGAFSSTGALGTGRFGHTTVRLPSGDLLVTGGLNSGNVPLAGSERYDPLTGTFRPAGVMATARQAHQARLLPNGRVLVAGGKDSSGASLASAECYDPALDAFAPTGRLVTGRAEGSATPLGNGRFLLAGGTSGSLSLAAAEEYDPQDPAPGLFSALGPLVGPRMDATATLLWNGQILVAGGTDPGGSPLASTERYDPATGVAQSLGPMATARQFHTATLLPTGRVLLAGGSDGTAPVGTSELFDPTTGTLLPGGTLGSPRQSHTATLLPNGKVLLVGGWNGSAVMAGCELYDPATGLFSATGSLNTARRRHMAVLLSNGKVLVAGGDNGPLTLVTAELYDPATGLFTTTGFMSTGRDFGTATPMRNGKVLVTGGWNGSFYPNTADVYDPATGTFSTTGLMTTRRAHHAAVLMPSGKVLLAGGDSGGAALASGELYDPATGVFTATGSLAAGRSSAAALLMPNGRALLLGGYDGVSTVLASAEQFQ